MSQLPVWLVVVVAVELYTTLCAPIPWYVFSVGHPIFWWHNIETRFALLALCVGYPINRPLVQTFFVVIFSLNKPLLHYKKKHSGQPYHHIYSPHLLPEWFRILWPTILRRDVGQYNSLWRSNILDTSYPFAMIIGRIRIGNKIWWNDFFFKVSQICFTS